MISTRPHRQKVFSYVRRCSLNLERVLLLYNVFVAHVSTVSPTAVLLI